jgi:hypothetical protein
MIKSFVLFLALFPATLLPAQNITKETIQWNASSFTDLDANEEVSNSCQFITYGTNKVKWIQDNGNSVLEWKVTSTKGSWPNVDSNGSFKYKISGNQLTGDLTLSKEGAGWIIELIVTGGTSDIRLRYSISSISKL